MEEVAALGPVAAAPLLLLGSSARPLAETPRRQDASNYDQGGVWRNTEDEILKAAVMKYGKTSGLGLPHCCIESQQSSAKPDGMSGWIQALRKQNGPEKKRKNSCTWPS